MTNSNKLFSSKIFYIISILIVISIVLVIILFNIKIKKSISAILEVDQNKNLSLKFSTSNISIIMEQKDLSIILESKVFVLKDVEFTYMGNNIYRINFENDELYHLLKTNSIYEVKIFSGSKKILDYIFNI